MVHACIIGVMYSILSVALELLDTTSITVTLQTILVQTELQYLLALFQNAHYVYQHAIPQFHE